MAGLWVQLLVALVGGAVGSAATLGAFSRRRRRTAAPVPEQPASTAPGLDRWLHRMRRCEQAVRRAAQAVDSVSSSSARLDLRSVVRRMDAELPHVRALVELGRALDAAKHDDVAAATRVLRQLDDAANRFGALADQVRDAVVDLVAAPDLDRMHQRVVALRAQFPLQRPMSALRGDPEPLAKAAG